MVKKEIKKTKTMIGIKKRMKNFNLTPQVLVYTLFDLKLYVIIWNFIFTALREKEENH